MSTAEIRTLNLNQLPEIKPEKTLQKNCKYHIKFLLKAFDISPTRIFGSILLQLNLDLFNFSGMIHKFTRTPQIKDRILLEI